MLCLSLSLFLTGLSPSAATPPASSADGEHTEVSPAERRVHLVISDAPGQDRSDMEYWLKQSSDKVFRQYAIPPVPPSPEPPWTIRIEASGHAYAFHSSVALIKAGTKDVAPPPLVECKCTTEDFLRSIEDRMRALIDAELAPTPKPSPLLSATPERTDEPPFTPAPPPVTPTDEPSPPSRRGGFGGFGIAGVVVTAAGIGSFGYGLDRRIRGEEYVDRSAGDMVLHYRTPGTEAAFGIGIAAIGVGVALIVIDQAVCKQRPRGCRRSVTSTAAQTALTWRF